jgi:hypothetical protein
MFSFKRKKFEDSDNDQDDDDIDLFDNKKQSKKRVCNKVILKHTFEDSKASQDKKKSFSDHHHSLIDSDSDHHSLLDSSSNSPITTSTIEKEAEMEVQRLLKSFEAEADLAKPDSPTNNNSISNKKTEEIDKMLKDIEMKKVLLHRSLLLSL